MRQTIAVDIDDVLADNAAAFIEFSNKRWGTNLTIDDYNEHWGKMWQIDHAETELRSIEYHASGVIGKYNHNPQAKPVLRELARRYRLIVITSRRQVVMTETETWLETYFTGIFDKVIYAGFYDKKQLGFHLTKADLCLQEGAEYLVDDQLKHCLSAADAGLTALLFGNYSWNKNDKPLPEKVTRVADWQAVAEYFAKENR